MKFWNARRPLGLARSGRWTTDSVANTETSVWAETIAEAKVIAAGELDCPPEEVVVRRTRLGFNPDLLTPPPTAQTHDEWEFRQALDCLLMKYA